MASLIVISIILGFILLFWALDKFHDYVEEHYDYSFFTWHNFVVTILTIGTFSAVYQMVQANVHTPEMMLNIYVALGFGVLLLFYEFFIIAKKTTVYLAFFVLIYQMVLILFSIVGLLFIISFFTSNQND